MHTEILPECQAKLDGIENTISIELKNIHDKLTIIDATLMGRITETRDWLASFAKKFDGNGTTGFEARLRGLEILVAENARAIASLAESMKEFRNESSKVKDMITGAIIQFAVTALMGGGLVYALWDKGFLKK